MLRIYIGKQLLRCLNESGLIIMNKYYSRIDFIGDINELSLKVCEDFGLIGYLGTKVVELGYEDFNAIISTDSNKYLMKVFANSRDDKEMNDCVKRVCVALENGVVTPKLYENNDGEVLSIIKIGESRFRVILMEYIDGSDFVSLKEKPNLEELKVIVDIASTINKIDYKPDFIYDSWAIPNFCKEYEKKIGYISDEYVKILEPVYSAFKAMAYDNLPKAFVHGDIRSSNFMRDVNGKIWIIDFNVSNYIVRLNEIAVICYDTAVIMNDRKESKKRINYVFDMWCKNVGATDVEKASFELLFKVANAINVMNVLWMKETGGFSSENNGHLAIGLFGLSLFNDL